jgi:hypothetical protein
LRNSGELGTKQETFDKIKGALIQQDILPAWIDAFLAVSFKPLTRVDAKRAYAIGAVDEQQLRNSFQDQGYSDSNASIMVNFVKKQARVAAMKNPAIRLYANGELPMSALRSRMQSEGVPDDAIEYAAERATEELQRNTQKACVGSIKKRYMLGELNNNELVPALQEFELDTEQIDALVASFQCQKHSRGKAIPASTLCGWYERGAINEIDLYKRLLNLGYTQDDATALTRDCMTRVGIKLDKEKQRQLKAEALQQRQVNAQLAAANRQFNKQILEGNKAIAKARTVKQQRQAKVLDIAEIWSKKTATKLSLSVELVRKIIEDVALQGFAPIELIMTAMEDAAKNPMILDPQTYFNEVATMVIDVVS